MALTPTCAQLIRLEGADSLRANWVCCDPNAATPPNLTPPPAGLISDSDPDPRSGIATNGCLPPTGSTSPGTAIGIFGAPTGSIPPEFFSARNLNKLTVYNSVQGSLDLTRATTLSYLKLYRNANVQLVNGSFSASPNLQQLVAPKNGMAGEFPSSILDKGLLSVLNLTDNRFSGAIPSNLAQKLPFLAALDLSYNQFQGSFPNLAVMKNLEVLDASNNQFTDFPSTLPSNLRILRFANNPDARASLVITPALQHVHVSGNPALIITMHAGTYALKELFATGGVKVYFHSGAQLQAGVALSCTVDADLACIMDPMSTGSNAGEVGPSVTGRTGRATNPQFPASSSAGGSLRTLAEQCGVTRRCPGGGSASGGTTNLVDPPTAGLEASTASSTDIAIRASALSVSMCAVVVILVYGGRQWFKYRKRRKRARHVANETGYDMSTSMSTASKPGHPPPPPPPGHPLSHLQQLHSQTQTSTVISSPHLHTGTTLVYPIPTAPGASAMYATAVPSPSMQWYPTATPSLGPGGIGSIMSPPQPPPPLGAAQLVAVPQPPPPGQVYLQPSPIPPHPPTIPHPHPAYFTPSSRPSTPTSPPRLSPSLSSGAPLSPIAAAGTAADPIHDRRPSTVSSLFGSVRTTKLPPSPPIKPTHLDPTKYAYDFEFGDHQSEKSRRSKLLTSAWVRDHALPAAVASPTTASIIIAGDGSSPSAPSASLAVSSSLDPVGHLYRKSVSSPAAAHHLGPIATSSPTSASPSTHDHLPIHLLPPPDQTPSPSAAAAAADSPAFLATVSAPVSAANIESITSRFPRDPFAARVVHSHEPDMGDEIALLPGDAVWVDSVFVDGWGAGTNLTRNVMGVFPLVCIVPEVGDQVDGEAAVEEQVIEEKVYVPPPASKLGQSVGGPAYTAPPAAAKHTSPSHSPHQPSRPTSLLSHLRARLPNAQPASPPHSRLSSPTTPTPSATARLTQLPSEAAPAAARRPSTAPVPKHAIQASKAAVPRIVTRGLEPALAPAPASGIRRSRSTGELTVMAAAAVAVAVASGPVALSATWPPPAGEEEEDEVATVILPAGDRDVGEDECLARWKVRQRAMGQLVGEERT